MKKWVIFDLDGTLADIEDRRQRSITVNGKMNWDVFFDPELITLDLPNGAVITMACTLKEAGYNIAIFSGRSDRTKDATIKWLSDWNVPYDKLVMRMDGSYKPDERLKSDWLDRHLDIDDVLCVFDDRDKVVNMWRERGLTCMQVAPGDF